MLEIEIDAKPRTLSIVAVSELADDGQLVRTRLYYRRANIDGEQHYRDRMLSDKIEARFHPTVERYQKALLERNAAEFIATFAADAFPCTL